MTKMGQDALNASFIDAMRNDEQRGVLEGKMQTYIKRRVRETGFARHFLHPQPVTKFEVHPDIGTDTVYWIGDIEPDSAALELNFRGDATGVYARSKRYIVPFSRISTQRMSIEVDELYAYQMPLVQVIQRNQVKDIEEAEDVKFINLCHTAVAQSGQSLDEGAEPVLTKLLLSKLFNLIDGQELDCVALLLNKVTYNDLLSQDVTQYGDDLTSKTTLDGWTYDKILGKRLTTTRKVNICQNKEVWAFVSQEYFGHFLMLGALEFYIRQVFTMLQWQSKEVIGMNIGNVKGCARLRYSTAVGGSTSISHRKTHPPR